MWIILLKNILTIKIAGFRTLMPMWTVLWKTPLSRGILQLGVDIL